MEIRCESQNFIFIDVITYKSYFSIAKLYLLYSNVLPVNLHVIFYRTSLPVPHVLQWGSLIPHTYKYAWESATSRASSFLIKNSFFCQSNSLKLEGSHVASPYWLGDVVSFPDFSLQFLVVIKLPLLTSF